jgi:hypothetical protein
MNDYQLLKTIKVPSLQEIELGTCFLMHSNPDYTNLILNLF